MVLISLSRLPAWARAGFGVSDAGLHHLMAVASVGRPAPLRLSNSIAIVDSEPNLLTRLAQIGGGVITGLPSGRRAGDANATPAKSDRSEAAVDR